MICPQCRGEVSDSADFCPQCGEPLGRGASAPAEPPDEPLTEALMYRCPGCDQSFFGRQAMCPNCSLKMAYCPTRGCSYAGLAGMPLCPDHGEPLTAVGQSWGQRFRDPGNTCFSPEASRLASGARLELGIVRESDSPLGACGCVTCDGREFYAADTSGYLLHAGFDRVLQRTNFYGGADPLMPPIMLNRLLWLAIEDGHAVCCAPADATDVIYAELDGGRIQGGLIHNGKWLAAAGQDRGGQGCVWVWSRPEPLTFGCEAPVVVLPAWHGSTLFVGAGRDLMAVDVTADTTAERWRQALAGEVMGHLTVVPTAQGQGIATVSEAGGTTHLQLWDAETGTERWRAPVAAGLPLEGASADYEHLYLVVEEQIQSYDVRTGQLADTIHLGTAILSPVTTTADTLIAVTDQQIIVVSKTTADRVVQPLPPISPLMWAPVVFSDNWLAVAEAGGFWGWQLVF
ncbi:MAG: zinc ribbon domain-containing protein [Armatimonadetes bacterium]|nr:zinc ribbon domain-containing protein [Armatimonadota bacterium]